MPSFRISITASRRAAARFVTGVRRKILLSLEQENAKRGLKQTDIARTIGVHRSVINRELRGKKDITLGRVAEIASAMGRVAVIEFPESAVQVAENPPVTATTQDDFDFRMWLRSVPSATTESNPIPLAAANNNYAPTPRVIAL